MGLNPHVYWLGNFIFDYIVFLLMVVVFIIYCATSFTFSDTSVVANTMIFVIVGIAVIIITYLLGMLYPKANDALEMTSFLFFYNSQLVA